MSGFYEVVLDWMRAEHKGQNFTSVDDVKSYGTDWYGDTESGFSQNFEVTIYYTQPGNRRRQEIVQGEALERLWHHVVWAGWPEMRP